MFNNALLMGATAQGGDSLVTIDNSAYIGGGATLSKTFSSAPTDGKKWTLSTWVNPCTISNVAANYILSVDQTLGYPSHFAFSTTNQFSWGGYTASSATGGMFLTGPLYRDTNAWYHACLIYDSTLSTAADRVQIWVNGVRITTFVSYYSEPALNAVCNIGINGYAHIYGLYYAANRTLNSYLAETYFIDGTALTAGSFGEFDTTGLYWTPKILQLLQIV